MDISNWKQFNHKVKAGRTTKKYFSKYLYKLSVYAPASRLAEHGGSIKTALGDRRYEAANASWVPSWNRDLDKADVSFLEVLREIRANTESSIKMTIAEPKVNFYAATEKELLDLVSKKFDKSHYQYVTDVSGPESEEAKTLLNSGAIIRRNTQGYTHKVILRDGQYTQEVKTNLLNYLDSLGSDLIKIPGNLKKQLDRISTRPTGYMWGIYFYTNDPSVATFVNIIHPTLVSKCHELAILDAK